MRQFLARCQDAVEQHQLTALRPLYAAGDCVFIYACMGVALLSVGIVMLFANNNAYETEIDYTNCELTNDDKRRTTDGLEAGGLGCEDYLMNSTLLEEGPCICNRTIEISEDVNGKVWFYYGLERFYQNYRTYVKSRDDYQLMGNLTRMTKPSSDCWPYQYSTFYTNTTNNSTLARKDETKEEVIDQKLPIVPCGAVANSLFNDTFQLLFHAGNQTRIPVPLVHDTLLTHQRQIGWKHDNPDNMTHVFRQTAKPPHWSREFYNSHFRHSRTPDKDGLRYEPFIIWMDNAALPKFRKKWAWLDINRNSSIFSKGLPKGIYSLIIRYRFPVRNFGGRKRFITVREGWFGSKAVHLPIAYIGLGTIFALLSVVFVIIHMFFCKISGLEKKLKNKEIVESKSVRSSAKY